MLQSPVTAQFFPYYSRVPVPSPGAQTPVPPFLNMSVGAPALYTAPGPVNITWAPVAPAALPFRSQAAPTLNWQSAQSSPVAWQRPAPLQRAAMAAPIVARPIPTTGYNWESSKVPLSYSEAVKAMEAGQVRHATILYNPASYTELPSAELEFSNGAKRRLMLPRETEPFVTMLEEHQVDYEYRSTAKTGWAKLGQDMGGVAKEMFMPFVMLAAAGASAAWAMKRFQQAQSDGETREAIRKARKDLGNYQYDFNDIIRDHEPPVQRALQAFLRDEKQVVVAKGLPGIGKTHVFLSLAKEISQRNEGVMILEIRPGGGDSVRDLLGEMYSGDRTLAQKAIRFLEKENGGQPVKELLLYADEVENIPGNLMKQLINNAVGNPTTTVSNLPRLRILATCNSWPNFINNSAALSRSGAVVVTPPTPRIVADIFTEALAEALPGKVDVAKLTPVAREVMREYDGYSPRTITQTVAKQVANTLTQENRYDPESVGRVLRDTLAMTPLNDTEVAALLVRMLIHAVMRGQQPLEMPNGPDNLWKTLLDDAEAATKGMLFLVESNGKQYKRTIQELIKRTPLDYVADPQAFKRAVTSITDALKVERLPGLMVRDPQLMAEKELTNQYADFLVRCVEKERGNPDPKGAHKSAEIIAALEKAAQNLRHVDRTSEAGRALARAAVIYQRLKAVEDPTDAAFLDRDKLDAVFTRTLDYDPALHTEKNDYVLVADPDYAALFKLLSRVLRLSLA